MWGISIQWMKILILLIPPLLKAEDSLQSALNAVNRRQRDLSDNRYGEYDTDGYSRYGYSGEPTDNEGENLAFLPPDYPNERKTDVKPEDLEQALYEYLQERAALDGSGSTDQISSFRERMEKDKQQQPREAADRLGDAILAQFYAQEDRDDEGVFTDPVPHAYVEYSDNFGVSKKDSLGWGSVGMKKRSRYFQPDGPSDPSVYLLNYAPRDEIFDRLQEPEDGEEGKSYAYPQKRFPVTKRSSSFKPVELFHQEKRSPKKVPKTDPKVEKELVDIFSPKRKENEMKEKDMLNAKPTEKPSMNKKPVEEVAHKEISKEQIPSATNDEKPLDVKKKSVKWSDYFGLDRKKKASQAIDKRWLLDRYHTAAGTTTDGFAPKFYVGHIPPKKAEPAEFDDRRFKAMDDKLKFMEDSLIDEALKITGAHQGDEDTKEVLAAKEKIISRLVTAYRLEKMRHALDGYKMKLMQAKPNVEEKRASVARKQAIDEERAKQVEDDNNIKCAQGDEKCDEQNYKTPREILERTAWDGNTCPKHEKACNEVAAAVGPFGHVFEAACNFYQMCMICGDNSWFPPTRQCNIFFLAKTDDLCDGDPACRRAARQSVKYLLHVNKTLREDPFTACECPDKN